MEPYVLGHEEGEAIWMFDALDTIKADAERTGGGLTVVEFLDFEGSSVPLHVNDRWDVGFYILDGRYRFVIVDRPWLRRPERGCTRRGGLRMRGGVIRPRVAS